MWCPLNLGKSSPHQSPCAYEFAIKPYKLTAKVGLQRESGRNLLEQLPILERVATDGCGIEEK